MKHDGTSCLFKEVGLRASERHTPRQCVLGKRKERIAAILSLESIIPGIYSGGDQVPSEITVTTLSIIYISVERKYYRQSANGIANLLE